VIICDDRQEQEDEGQDYADGADAPFGCHCDGFDIHCDSYPPAEGICECREYNHDGMVGFEVHCADVDESCHCEADELHCSTSAQELVADTLMCHCHEGVLECDTAAVSSASETNQSQNNDSDKPWTEVIVSTFLVNLSSLAGIFVVVGQWLNKVFCKAKASPRTVTQWRGTIFPMFACGAIMGTVFFMILPEALHLIEEEFGEGEEDHDHRLLREQNPHAQVSWRWGTSIIGGFLIPVFTHALFPHAGHSHHHDGHDAQCPHRHCGVDQMLNENDAHRAGQDAATSAAEETAQSSKSRAAGVIVEETFDVDTSSRQNSQDDGVSPVDIDAKDDLESADTAEMTSDGTPKTLDQKYNIPLILSLTIGDFAHQFSDGIFIGTAWYICDRELAITLATATIIHAFPHQLSDYLILIALGGMKPWQANTLNFITGLSMVLGGIVVLAAEPEPGTIGYILAVGAGALMYVAFVECLHTAERTATRPIHKLFGFMAFLSGAIPIGLVLLKGQHCNAH
jgi:zinc transporter ZupT